MTAFKLCFQFPDTRPSNSARGIVLLIIDEAVGLCTLNQVNP
jgi:hypothetical protein